MYDPHKYGIQRDRRTSKFIFGEALVSNRTAKVSQRSITSQRKDVAPNNAHHTSAHGVVSPPLPVAAQIPHASRPARNLGEGAETPRFSKKRWEIVKSIFVHEIRTVFISRKSMKNHGFSRFPMPSREICMSISSPPKLWARAAIQTSL